eukprot:1432933-Heterocapsa_arctica.AAC.1
MEGAAGGTPKPRAAALTLGPQLVAPKPGGRKREAEEAPNALKYRAEVEELGAGMEDTGGSAAA